MGKESKVVTFHQKVLSVIQKKVLRQLGPLMTQKHFYLGGGTALAIYLGHRHSVDLDWFTQERIADPMLLAQDIRDQGIPIITGQIDRGTLHGTMSGIRVSFLEYRYPMLKPLISWPGFGCLIAPLEDIACMKLSALAQRGSKKDFMDIYALGLKYFHLRDMLSFYQRKYSVKDIAHILYGLAYFDDADKERMPKMLWDTDWRTVKRTIRGWIKKVAL
jgi:hypothetical protein